MGRDPTLWGDDCMEFKPERWENFNEVTADSPHRRRPGERRKSALGLPARREGDDLDFLYVFPIFHAGPRQCLGKRMAYMEMTVAMVHIFRDFDFELAEAPEATTFVMSLTLAIKGGLKMKFTPRKSTPRKSTPQTDREAYIESVSLLTRKTRG